MAREEAEMPSIQAIREFLAQRSIEVWEFAVPTPSAETAAGAVGCSVAEIAKSLLFMVGETPVVVVTSGDMKVKTSQLRRALGAKGRVRFTSPAEVKDLTGYDPGGVCPFLLPQGLRVVIDRSLRRFPRVYAAAGNDHSAVAITCEELLEITGGSEVEVCAADSPLSADGAHRHGEGTR
jgi:prolyl-tRNA editing enzyme YbaK/EbsC (Cys-tRNA(Pro) deacylase)